MNACCVYLVYIPVVQTTRKPPSNMWNCMTEFYDAKDEDDCKRICETHPDFTNCKSACARFTRSKVYQEAYDQLKNCVCGKWPASSSEHQQAEYKRCKRRLEAKDVLQCDNICKDCKDVHAFTSCTRACKTYFSQGQDARLYREAYGSVLKHCQTTS